MQHWPDVTIKKIKLSEQNEKPNLKKKTKNIIRSGFKKFYNSKLVSSLKENPAHRFSYDTDIPYYINLFQVKQRNLVNKTTAIIAEEKPDIVQIDFIDYIDFVFAIPSNIKKVFVHHELRFVRLQSFFSENKHTMAPYDNYIIEKIKNEEFAFLKQYDGIFVFSETDRQKLVSEGVSRNIYVTPFSILDEYFIPVTKENTSIEKLVFVGGENHSPNIDAIEWYINELAAAINKVKKMVLHIAGKWSEGIVNKYRNNPNVHFAGYVEDLIDFCKQSIMLVPIRMGSGIRTKILYAMAQGVPVISTSLGCEGIGLKNNESILIAETPEAFGTALKTIINNTGATLKMIQSAQSVAYNNYSQANVAALRKKYFEKVLNN